MKFKIDENLPAEVTSLLKKNGYDAISVLQQEPSGAADADIAEVCRQEERAIMTLDTDFADIRAYPPEDFFGIIVLRLKRQDKSYVLSVVKRLVSVLQKEPVIRNLWIVEEDRVRISGKENP